MKNYRIIIFIYIFFFVRRFNGLGSSFHLRRLYLYCLGNHCSRSFKGNKTKVSSPRNILFCISNLLLGFVWFCQAICHLSPFPTGLREDLLCDKIKQRLPKRLWLGLVSHVGWVCCWCWSLLWGFFLGSFSFPPFAKTNILNSNLTWKHFWNVAKFPFIYFIYLFVICFLTVNCKVYREGHLLWE